MAAAATITITASITGLPTGTKTVSIPVVISAPIDASTVVNLASGATTITPPVGARGVIVIPPAANAVALTLKGVTGDTGVPLDLLNPTLVSLPASPGTFVLTAGAILNGLELLYF